MGSHSANNSVRGESHELWLASRVSDPEDPMAQSLAPELVLQEGATTRHPGGRTAKVDIAAQGLFALMNFSAKAVDGAGSLNQLQRQWLTDLFPRDTQHPALSELALMCGSVDGKSILPCSGRSSPSDWPADRLALAFDFLDKRKAHIASQALGLGAGVTHVFLSFFDVEGLDHHFCVPASMMSRALCGSASDPWSAVSARGSAISLGAFLTLKRKGGDGGADRANQAQVSLRSPRVLARLLCGAIPGARHFKEPAISAASLFKEGFKAWSPAWMAEKSELFALHAASLPDRVEQAILARSQASDGLDGRAKRAAAKSQKSLLGRIRIATPIAQRAWLSGAVALRMVQLGGSPTSAEFPGWNAVLVGALGNRHGIEVGSASRQALKTANEEGHRKREAISEAADKFREALARTWGTRKHLAAIKTLSKIADAMGDGFLDDAATLLNAGLSPLKIAGLSSLGDAVRISTRERCAQAARALREGASLAKALEPFDGQLLPYELKLADRRGPDATQALGPPLKVDQARLIVERLAKARGLHPDAKSAQLLRACLRKCGESDQALIEQACLSGFALQKSSSGWSSAEGRAAARQALSRFLLETGHPQAAELAKNASERGEPDVLGKQARSAYLRARADKSAAKRGLPALGTGHRRIRSFMESCESDAEISLGERAIAGGVNLSGVCSMSRFSDLARAEYLALLERATVPGTHQRDLYESTRKIVRR